MSQGSTASRPYRIEAWEQGDKVTVLVMAQETTIVPAWSLVLDRGTGRMLHGTGYFRLEHYPDAIRAPRDLLVSALLHGKADRDAYRMFGLKQRRLDFIPILAWEVSHCIVTDQEPDISYSGRSMRTCSLGGGLPWANERNGYLEDTYWMMGYAVKEPPLRRSLQCHLPPSHQGAPVTLDVLPPEQERPHVSAVQVIAKKLHAAMAPIRRHFGDPGTWGQDVQDLLAQAGREAAEPKAPDFLGEWNWNHAAHAFYAEDGQIGDRRRQAARLYPVFAPMITAEMEISALVDAGRPYEEAMARLCTSLLVGRSWTVTVPILRRFRTLDDVDFLRKLTALLWVAVRLPVEWLPESSRDWAWFRPYMPMLGKFAFDARIEFADLVRPYAKDWKSLYDLCHGLVPPTAGGSVVSIHLQDALDLPKRLKETLVMPMMWALAEEEIAAGASDNDCLDTEVYCEADKVAGPLLFGGKSLMGVLKLSHRWHQALPSFEQVLPPPAVEQGWPALVEGFTASNGLRLVPLSDGPALRREGDRLQHCVGGYAPRCLTGESHIFSVRRTSPGGEETASTLEIGVKPGTFTRLGDRHHPSSLCKLQHRAAGNRAPSPEEQDAVDEFMGELLTGNLPLNPAALAVRNQRGHGAHAKEVYDWRDPANLEKAFAAWSPYLPRGTAKQGVSALKESLRPRIKASLDLLARLQMEYDARHPVEADA